MSKHAILMLVCCLVPMALIGVIIASGINVGGILPFAIMLLCPLMHIVMMRGMKHDHRGHRDESQDQPVSAPSCHGDGRSAPVEAATSRR